MLFTAIRRASASKQGYGTFDPNCRECEVGETVKLSDARLT